MSRVQKRRYTTQVPAAALYLLHEARVMFSEIQHSNFHDYPVLRTNEVPEVHLRLIESGDSPSAVGEVGALVPAPAIGNAFAKLTGKRLRHVPFTAARVRTFLDT